MTQALGPIAKLLVKRALPNAATEQALWERLATHIERAPDRETFLRQRQAVRAVSNWLNRDQRFASGPMRHTIKVHRIGMHQRP